MPSAAQGQAEQDDAGNAARCQPRDFHTTPRLNSHPSSCSLSARGPPPRFLVISHNKIAMEMAQQLIGVTMQEQGVSRIVAVDMESALTMAESALS